MKPVSIVFLIISVLVIVAGLVVCTVGVNIARETDVALFATDVSMVNGDVIRSDKLNISDINKVKMKLDHVDVYIKASETGEAYMELHNFRIGTYDYSVQNKMLLVDNETSIFSLMHIAEGNFSFSGLRHYLTYRTGENTKQAVYLYLTEDAAINSFDIVCTRGNVMIEGLSISTDYSVSIGAGDITLRNISTKSNVSVSTDKGIVTLDSVTAKATGVVIGRGAADLYMKNIPNDLSVAVTDGDIVCGYKSANGYGLELTLTAPNGTITHNGEVKAESPFVYKGAPTGAMPQNLRAYNGNVTVLLSASGVTGQFDALSKALSEEADEDETTAETAAGTDTSGADSEENDADA